LKHIWQHFGFLLCTSRLLKGPSGSWYSPGPVIVSDAHEPMPVELMITFPLHYFSFLVLLMFISTERLLSSLTLPERPEM